jgi:2-aminoadipate transaminase
MASNQMQQHYKDQCKAILTALRDSISSDIMDYNTPTGGMFLWATLKNDRFRGVSSHDLFVKLAAKGIIAVPGDEFYVPPVDGAAKREFPCLRLSFAAPSVGAIKEGASRLGKALLE